MDQESLRLLIQRKIQDGRLPHDGSRRVQGSPSTGERCDACEAVLSLDQLLIEVRTAGQILLQLHVRCFELWELEKQGVPGYSSYSE
jgi:hypothetical protein